MTNSLTHFSSNAFTEPKWNTEIACLQIDAEGFVTSFNSTLTSDAVIDIVKEIFGVGEAITFFAQEFTPGAQGATTSFGVHRLVNDEWRFERELKLESSQSESYLSFAFTRQLNSDKERVSLALDFFRRLRLLYSDIRAQRLLLAGHWLFDSNSGSDEILSFVQAMIALETLLGDKAATQSMSLTELIRNRCAYLVAKDLEEREMLMTFFPTIYDVRSRIVHAGKRRLTAEERDLFVRLKWICHRVLLKEIQLFG